MSELIKARIMYADGDIVVVRGWFDRGGRGPVATEAIVDLATGEFAPSVAGFVMPLDNEREALIAFLKEAKAAQAQG